MPLWQVNLSWIGLAAFLGGIVAIVWSFAKNETWLRMLIRCGGMLLIALGVLFQGDGAPWFYALLALAILILLFVPSAWDWIRGIRHWMRSIAERRRARREAAENSPGTESGAVTATIVLVALMLSSLSSPLPGGGSGWF